MVDAGKAEVVAAGEAEVGERREGGVAAPLEGRVGDEATRVAAATAAAVAGLLEAEPWPEGVAVGMVEAEEGAGEGGAAPLGRMVGEERRWARAAAAAGLMEARHGVQEEGFAAGEAKEGA